jgi:hypothetical protein
MCDTGDVLALSAQHPLYFPFGHGGRRVGDTTPYEIANPRRLSKEIENSIIIFHFDHQVARVQLALAHHAFAVAHFGNAFDRDNDLAEVLFQTLNLDSAFDSFLDGFLAAALNLHHVPALVAWSRCRLAGRLIIFVDGRRPGWRRRFTAASVRWRLLGLSFGLGFA